jgi:hypothetical protein
MHFRRASKHKIRMALELFQPGLRNTSLPIHSDGNPAQFVDGLECGNIAEIVTYIDSGSEPPLLRNSPNHESFVDGYRRKQLFRRLAWLPS